MLFVFKLVKEKQEDTTWKKSVYEFDNETDAIKSFHSNMSASVGNCYKCRVEILDENLICYKGHRAKWDMPIVETIEVADVEQPQETEQVEEVNN